MSTKKHSDGLSGILVVVAVIAFLLIMVFFTGCASSAIGERISRAGNPLGDLITGNADTTDPRVIAAVQLTRWGVLCVVGGIIFGAVTKFRSGWGLSIAGAGLGMILLAWTIQEWWWLGLLSVAAYAAYKVHNRFNPNCRTEGLLE